MGLLDRALNIGESKQFREYEKRVAIIGAFEPELELESDEELRERFDALRERARDGESLDDLLPETFAVVREVGKRTMGMRHFDVQLIGGMVLHGGNIAEMKTGEGKTLTATLAVVLNALAGKGVHLVTVNDYLARRDAEWMGPIYSGLGLTVGVLQNMQSYEDKHVAYGADITYGTNSEFGFDYLRDNMATSLEEKVQRGHPFGVVDEVDNILIDEARTPLIISGAPEQAAELYQHFAKLARVMEAGKKPEGLDPRAKKDFVADFDFEFEEKHKTVSVTEQGVAKAERFLGIEHLYRAENGHLVNHLHQALKAESLYKRDVDYAVIDDEVRIIDEFTGRILEGRRWSEGLHQAVEAKEGVRVQEENQTLATITLQNYFRLYDKLSGMTGTALTEATEFMKIYKLGVVQIPTNRADGPRRTATIRSTRPRTASGTRWPPRSRRATAPASRCSSARSRSRSPRCSPSELKRKGIAHTVLNAKPEHAEREGEIVAEAGQPGAVTIATNMAGRGVDIKLGGNPEHLTDLELAKLGLRRGDPDYDERFAEILPSIEARVEEDREKVVEAGGLFIIGTERHESRRIDNQLRGRSGRQGDPASRASSSPPRTISCACSPATASTRSSTASAAPTTEGNEEPIEAGMLSKQIEKAQRKVEEQNFLTRKRVLEYDDVMNEQRRIVYEYRDQVLEGRDMGEQSRQEIAGVVERLVDEYAAADYVEDWDLEGLFAALEDIYPVSVSAADVDRLEPRPRRAGRAPRRRRDRALRPPRGGARRGAHARARALPAAADHRSALARAPLRHGLPARGHPPARLRPDRSAGGLQERGLHAVLRPHEHHLVGLLAHDLPRRGAGRGRERRRARTAVHAVGLVDPGGPRLLLRGRRPRAAQRRGRGGRRAPAKLEAEPEVAPVQQRRVAEVEQIGRNDPCWCGSGKKFKRCHGA